MSDDKTQADLLAEALGHRPNPHAESDGDLVDRVSTARADAEANYFSFVQNLPGWEEFAELLRQAGLIERAREPRDIGALVRRGRRPVEMLLPGWIVAGEFNLWYSEPSAGKTMLACWAALQVMEEGNRVAWIDEEIGEEVIAERFELVGTALDWDKERVARTLDDHLVYWPYPTWETQDKNDVYAWTALLTSFRPQLVVVDAMADALAAAGIDENDNRGVTSWVKTFLEPARRMGAAQLVLDHIPKMQGGAGKYARGAGAKRAKAKAQLSIEVIAEWSDDTVGEVEVTRTKNMRSAPIPKTHHLRIGGAQDVDPDMGMPVGEPRLVIEEIERSEKATAKKDASEFATRLRIKAALPTDEAEAMSSNKLYERVGGVGKGKFLSLLGSMVGDTWSIRVKDGPRGSNLYWVTPEA